MIGEPALLGSEGTLSGMQLLVWSPNFDDRTALMDLMRQSKWAVNPCFAETRAELATQAERLGDMGLFIVFEDDDLELERFAYSIVRFGATPNQVFLSAKSQSSILMRLAAEKFEVFYWNQRIDPSKTQLLEKLLSRWNIASSLLLDTEVAEGITSGFIACVSMLAKQSSIDQIKERAHLANAVAEQISTEFHFRRKVIRIALAMDLATVPDLDPLLRSRRSLQAVAQLLELRAAYMRKGLLSSKTLPADMPVELAIVETIRILQDSMPLTSLGIKEMILTLTRGLLLPNLGHFQNACSSILCEWAAR